MPELRPIEKSPSRGYRPKCVAEISLEILCRKGSERFGGTQKLACQVSKPTRICVRHQPGCIAAAGTGQVQNSRLGIWEFISPAPRTRQDDEEEQFPAIRPDSPPVQRQRKDSAKTACADFCDMNRKWSYASRKEFEADGPSPPRPRETALSPGRTQSGCRPRSGTKSRIAGKQPFPNHTQEKQDGCEPRPKTWTAWIKAAPQRTGSGGILLKPVPSAQPA